MLHYEIYISGGAIHMTQTVADERVEKESEGGVE